MADKKKDSGESSTEKISQHYRDFINKPEIKQLVQEGMLRLVQKMPSEPMLFLAEYFDSQSNVVKLDKNVRALQMLHLVSYFQPNFQSNLLEAYEIVSEPKTNGKKSTHTKPGLTGVGYEELITLICGKNVTKSVYTVLLRKIGCKPHEMVPFSVFKYGVTCCLVLLEFSNLCENLYERLKVENVDKGFASRDACTAVLTKFGNALSVTQDKPDISKATAMLEASYRLRPDLIAASLLDSSLQSSDCMSREEFVGNLVDTFVVNIAHVT